MATASARSRAVLVAVAALALLVAAATQPVPVAARLKPVPREDAPLPQARCLCCTDDDEEAQSELAAGVCIVENVALHRPYGEIASAHLEVVSDAPLPHLGFTASEVHTPLDHRRELSAGDPGYDPDGNYDTGAGRLALPVRHAEDLPPTAGGALADGVDAGSPEAEVAAAHRLFAMQPELVGEERVHAWGVRVVSPDDSARCIDVVDGDTLMFPIFYRSGGSGVATSTHHESSFGGCFHRLHRDTLVPLFSELERRGYASPDGEYDYVGSYTLMPAVHLTVEQEAALHVLRHWGDTDDDGDVEDEGAAAKGLPHKRFRHPAEHRELLDKAAADAEEANFQATRAPLPHEEGGGGSDAPPPGPAPIPHGLGDAALHSGQQAVLGDGGRIAEPEHDDVRGGHTHAGGVGDVDMARSRGAEHAAARRKVIGNLKAGLEKYTPWDAADAAYSHGGSLTAAHAGADSGGHDPYHSLVDWHTTAFDDGARFWNQALDLMASEKVFSVGRGMRDPGHEPTQTPVGGVQPMTARHFPRLMDYEVRPGVDEHDPAKAQGGRGGGGKSGTDTSTCFDRVTFGLPSPGWPAPRADGGRDLTLAHFRDFMLARMGFAESRFAPAEQHVCIALRPTDGRILNDFDLVQAIAEVAPASTLVAAGHSLMERVQRARMCTVVVGVTGSELTHALYTADGAVGIQIVPAAVAAADEAHRAATAKAGADGGADAGSAHLPLAVDQDPTDMAQMLRALGPYLEWRQPQDHDDKDGDGVSDAAAASAVTGSGATASGNTAGVGGGASGDRDNLSDPVPGSEYITSYTPDVWVDVDAVVALVKQALEMGINPSLAANEL